MPLNNLDFKAITNTLAGQGSLSIRDRQKPFKFTFQRISAGNLGEGPVIDLLAYINNISDSSSPEWDERLDIGRADPKILYRSFTRSISLSFSVAVESETNSRWNLDETQLDNTLVSNSSNRRFPGVESSRILSDPSVNKLSDKIIGGAIQRSSGTEYATRDVATNLTDYSKVSSLSTRLANITYPEITSGISIDTTLVKLNELSKLSLPVYRGPYVGSYVRFNIGKLYTNEMGYIKSLTFEWDNASIVWDEEKELPMITNVSMEIGYIGKRKPQVASNFFG